MMTIKFQRFGVIGAGAFGTALAQALCVAGRDVLLYARRQDVSDTINTDHENKRSLPTIKLDTRLRATSRLEDLQDCQVLLLAVPAQSMRGVCELIQERIIPTFPEPPVVVICAKGIEQTTGKMMATVVLEVLPNWLVAILSGPSFAHELARGLPTAVTLACGDEARLKDLIGAMASQNFRLYRNHDMMGVQLGGVVKNVLAIAAGIVAGKGFGENAAAGLITRALAEMVRLGTAMGAQVDTLMGLSGLGDLILTCGSRSSRNMSLGFALGQGRALADILSEQKGVAEGFYSASFLRAKALKLGIDVPIIAAVDDVLSRRIDIDGAIASLLTRPLKKE